MCLTLQSDWKARREEYRNKKEPIRVWKLLDPNMESLHRSFVWTLGENISSRPTADVGHVEDIERKIKEGFHFFLEKPGDCPCQYPCRYPCQYLLVYLYLYRCHLKNPVNILVKCEIDPEDVIAVGEWEDMDCIVATKATVV